jgi:hypothetical protein
MTTSRCPSWPSTQLPRNPPLRQPPEQPLTIAYLLCCGAKHLYVHGLSTTTELTEFAQQQD